MKRIKSYHLALSATLLLLLWGVWNFAQNYAYKPLWVDLGPVPDARNNPYFAAQQFLQKKGFGVKTAGLLSEVIDRLEPTDTLFLFYDHEIEYEALSGRINTWVEQGGHLVLTVHYLWDKDSQSSGDTYLDNLGVRQHLWPEAESDTASTEAEDNTEENTNEIDSNSTEASGDTAESKKPLTNLNIPNDAEKAEEDCQMDYVEPASLLPLLQGLHPLRIAFEPEYHIEDVSGNAHAAFTPAPSHLLQYARGAGKITVLTDYFLFNDNNIGDYDHAFFLWWLAQESPRIWLVYDKESETLLGLIWQSAPYLCVSGLLLISAWLMFRGRRFGPVLNAEHTQRRQLQEHIDASTAFMWRHHEQQKLIQEARQHVLIKAPALVSSHLLTPRLLRVLEQEGISRERAQWALTTKNVEDEAEFVALIQLLQQLRMSL